jgi:predicted permease
LTRTAMAAFGRSLHYDLRHAGRTLSRRPAFSVAAVLLLTAGVGGTTLVFSAVDAILLRELPVRDPGRLARIVEVTNNRPLVSEYPYRTFDQWRRRSRSFSTTFAQSELDVAYSDEHASRPVRVQIVTGSYYSALGVEAFRGRLLTAKDEWGGGDELPVVLSYRFWLREFHGNENVLGQVVHLEGRPFVVVGVTKPGFNGISVDTGPDMQVPFIAGRFLTAWGSEKGDPRSCCLWEIAGRLRPGVTFAQAQTETLQSMQAAWTEVFSEKKPLSAQDRQWIRERRLAVEPIKRGISWLRAKFSTGLLALLAAAVFLLVLACANVAGLLLARAAAEEQQNAIRLAVGASRARLTQQWLMEGALLASLGGLGGLLTTRALLPFVDGMLPPMRNLMTESLPPALHLSVDLRVFAFAVLICCGAALLTAIAPAWQATRADPMGPLKAANSNRRSARIRALLVACQVAVCTMVIGNAGLMVATLRNLEKMDPGFRIERVITFTVDTGLEKYDQAQTYALALRLEDETHNMPGVAAAAFAVKPLLRGAGMRFSVAPIGGARSAIEELNSDLNAVSPGYFETLGIRLLAGRTFDNRDLGPSKPKPVVVNETFMRRFFPHTNGVGERFADADGNPLEPRYEVIGVVADSKYRSLREAPFPAAFGCLRSADDLSRSSFELIIRASGDPKSVISEMRKTLRGIDARLPFREIHTLREDLDASLWAEYTLARLGSLFSALAVILAAIGLYGLLSFVVVERSREIGIRLALGAQPRDILRATTFRTLRYVAAGIASGLAGAIATALLLRSVLFEVSPWNAQTLVSSAAIVAVCAALATLAPALRAIRLDPADTLRHS